MIAVCFLIEDGWFSRPEPTTERDRWQREQLEMWTALVPDEILGD